MSSKDIITSESKVFDCEDDNFWIKFNNYYNMKAAEYKISFVLSPKLVEEMKERPPLPSRQKRSSR
jgi:hypothetical protein